MKRVKILIAASVGEPLEVVADGGRTRHRWLVFVCNENHDSVLLLSSRDPDECKSFANKLFNRQLEWTEDSDNDFSCTLEMYQAMVKPAAVIAEIPESTLIEKLRLKTRTYRCLLRAKQKGAPIETLGDIISYPIDRFGTIKGFGRKSMDDINVELVRLGFPPRGMPWQLRAAAGAGPL